MELLKKSVSQIFPSEMGLGGYAASKTPQMYTKILYKIRVTEFRSFVCSFFAKATI